MLKFTSFLFSAEASLSRPLTPATLLHTVRSNPGMTTQYYANRYFGVKKQMEVECIMWKELKKHGKVVLDRIDGPQAPPRWNPLYYYPRRHKVLRHCDEDEDLSVLSQGSSSTSEPEDSTSSFAEETEKSEDRDSVILRLVYATPGKDIQFYVSQLPEEYQVGAPQAFKRLREAGVLQRTQTSQGFFSWSC